MQWIKTKIKLEDFLLFIFITLFLLTRLTRLGGDEINPDAVNWHYRSEQFVVGLKTLNFEKTYQHYHPGVTLMWIIGPTVELVKQLYPSEAIYNQFNFEVFHFSSKFILIFVQLFLTLVILYQLSKIIGFLKAYFTVLLFSLEPFFVGNSRLLHLDVLLTLFLFLGLLFAYRAFKKYSFWSSILAGTFLSLSFLTKSLGVGGLFFVFIWGVFRIIKKDKFALKISLLMLLGFVITSFLLFPALWVGPVKVIVDIFKEGERIGIRKGHDQVVLSEYTKNAPWFFYLLVLGIKTSPFTIFGIILFVILTLKSILGYRKKHFSEMGSLIKWLGVFYVGYLIVMTFPSKKIDRYMVPEYPFLALVAVVGFYRASSIFSKHYAKILMSIFFVFTILYPLYKYFPYYFTYTSPLFGSPNAANRIIAQKSFGIGIQNVRDLIFAKYRHFPRLGFIDTKPMRTIYMSSRISDIRINGTDDYDLLILGINDEYNDDVQDMNIKFLDSSNGIIINETVFVKDASIYINDLEFWRVYVKENSQ